MNYLNKANQIEISSAEEANDLLNSVSTIKDQLTRQLDYLRSENHQVIQLFQSTRMREYTNIAKMYVWWREATKVEGLLEELYKATDSRRVNETGAEINFRRLINLVYCNSLLDKDSLDRKNRALIGIHEEYLKHKEKYEHDTAQKLADFIKSSGGIDGLIKKNQSTQDQKTQSKKTNDEVNHSISADPKTTCSKSDKEQYATAPEVNLAGEVNASIQSGDELTTTIRSKRAPVSQSNRQKILSEGAENYFSGRNPNQTIQISTPLETDCDDLGLALIKRVGDSYEVIGSMLPSRNIVQEVLSETYSKEFNAIPGMLRPLLETIKTQAMPKNLAKVFEKQALKASDTKGSSGELRYQKRIVYISASNSLLLSSVSTDSSVVTQAGLKNSFIQNGSGDYHLPVRCVKLLENRLLASNDFNLFKPATDQLVAVDPRLGMNSHAIQLDNKAIADDRVNLDIWRFEQGMNRGCEQVDFIYAEATGEESQFLITAADLKAFAFDHCNKWLASYGDYIKRPEHKIVGIEIGKQGLTLRYELENGKFNNQGNTSIGSLVSTQSAYSAWFLACDLLVAISGIAALDLEGRVTITARPDVVLIDFATSVADYRVAIPTVNGTVRNSSAFTKYKASIALGAGTVSAEQLQDPEYRAWILENNELVDDTALEQVLGVDSDDYEDFLSSDEEILNAVS
jgi:hypothetical protein